MACFELRAVTASNLVGRTNTQLIILCPQTDSILLDSNDDEEMAAPVNTGQLIYCSELILAHQKTSILRREIDYRSVYFEGRPKSSNISRRHLHDVIIYSMTRYVVKNSTKIS